MIKINACKNIFFKIKLKLLKKNWNICFKKNFNNLYATNILYFYENFGKLGSFSKTYIFFFISYQNIINLGALNFKKLLNCNIYQNNFFFKKKSNVYPGKIYNYFLKEFNTNKTTRILSNLGKRKKQSCDLLKRSNLHSLTKRIFFYDFNQLIFFNKNQFIKSFLKNYLYFNQYKVLLIKHLTYLYKSITNNLINTNTYQNILMNLKSLEATFVKKIKFFKKSIKTINFDVRYVHNSIWHAYNLITFKQKVFFYEWSVLLEGNCTDSKLFLKVFFIKQLKFTLDKIIFLKNFLDHNIQLKLANETQFLGKTNSKCANYYFLKNFYFNIMYNYDNQTDPLTPIHLFDCFGGEKLFKKIKISISYENNFCKNFSDLKSIELFFILNLKFYQNIKINQLICNLPKEIINMFTFFKFIRDLLFNEDPVLKFYDFLKYMTNIGKYIMSHYYPKNFFACFINFVHHKRFNALDESLNSVLYSKYIYLFKKPYISYKYIFEIFYNTFKYKNINFLVTFLIDLFKNVNFYKHQFLLFYIRCFMKLLNLPVFSEFNVNGIFIKFHGKIAKAGNSRRKKFLLQHRVISTAYKNNYIVEKFQLHSFTGVVGCTLILSFN